MAKVKIKGKVARSGDSPQGGTVVHITPEDPGTLQTVDGSYKAGAGEVAIHFPANVKAPKIGADWEGTAEEVGAGGPGAYLKGGGTKAKASAGVETPDDDDEGEMSDEDDDATEGGNKNK